MDLRSYVENLRGEFTLVAEAGGDRELAERLFSQLEAALRLTLLDALSDAADEITRDLAPGSVHVRLRGREPAFVVTPAGGPGDEPSPADEPAPTPGPVLAPDGDDGGTSRINLRLPDHLKASIEEAAGRAGLSVNAWLVRAAAGAVESGDRPRRPAGATEPKHGQRVTGWAR